MTYEHLKDFCISRNIDIRFNEPMSIHTSLKIGGPADIALFPNESSISELIKTLTKEGIPYIVIGGGTNILIKDSGIGGAVIFTSRINGITQNTEYRTQDADTECIFVQSGCLLQKVINLCIEHGLSGMEGLAGIPGSVGGAIAGNAGSFGYEIKDVIKSVNLVMPDGSIKNLSSSDIGFQYRSSNITSGAIILSTILCLRRDEPFKIKKRFVEFINEKKSRQPVSKLSAGCVFKNPKDIAAGKLIADAGCKGMRFGDIEVSTMHANFFINRGKGTADDFLKLMDIVSKKVKDKFGIVLEPEIKVLGR
ncbi:UDP-N-acetylenolpyruvoylglucosamine reductase [Dissulfurispira thermophila]|uniref:UDP-N-acetylenolpyruvoylglucosamine reductase n=1 Tax=Dissulfurispira thermophila TaxID=2715679 RepID=A0A7G1H153_9BACT|nr:UDP-N-acetylmuramate dehydrogenase [Dissulfurispira thermophila]BCB95863.1 UDP-N-acetylenolpyruvoylglucosamine reductase [Dissulfurispira thermophila]